MGATESAYALRTVGQSFVAPEGATYLAFLTAVDAPATGGRFVSYFETDQYVPGRIYGAVGGGDLAFVAQFASTTVPEPGTWLLVGSGCAVLALSVRRRRTRETQAGA